MGKENKTTQDVMHEIFKDFNVRDYYAAQAMLAVMGETQEMRIASFWDWLKYLMQTYLHFQFLVVKYIQVENVYKDAAKRCFEYANAMIEERNTYDKKEYELKLARIEEIFDAEPGTEIGSELEILCSWVKNYEDKNYPIPEPSQEAIDEFNKDQRVG